MIREIDQNVLLPGEEVRYAQVAHGTVQSSRSTVSEILYPGRNIISRDFTEMRKNYISMY